MGKKRKFEAIFFDNIGCGWDCGAVPRLSALCPPIWERATDQPSKKHARVNKGFAKLKNTQEREREMRVCRKLPEYRFSADDPSAAGFWSAVCSKERLVSRSFQLGAESNHFVVQSFLQFIFVCHLVCPNPPFSFLGKSWMPNLRTNTARALW